MLADHIYLSLVIPQGERFIVAAGLLVLALIVSYLMVKVILISAETGSGS
jgi:hypothetical protein